jgi:hypothetical protein
MNNTADPRHPDGVRWRNVRIALVAAVLFIIVSSAASAVNPLALPPVTDPDDRLGMCFVYHDAPDWHTLAVDALQG